MLLQPVHCQAGQVLHRPERYRTDAALPSGIGPELLEPADPLWRLVLPAAVVCVRALCVIGPLTPT